MNARHVVDSSPLVVSTRLAEPSSGDMVGRQLHTEDLVGFTETEGKLILVHELAVLLRTFGPHFGG